VPAMTQENCGGVGSRTVGCVFRDQEWSRGLAKQDADLDGKSILGAGPSQTAEIRVSPSRLTTS
jgi:hypothetical protein